MKDIKVIFMGTPNFSCEVLESLINNYNVILVVTNPDKEVGRKRILTPSPVKELAINNNIPVFQPAKIRQDYQKIIDLNPDIIITCAYGQIIPKEILECPKYGCINVHASLLPKLRGAAPIHRAIINGETKTGITIMYMDENLDTGNIISQKEIPILEEDNLITMQDKMSHLGADLLIETLPKIINGTNERIKQNDEESTYANMIKREDELIDFTKEGQMIINQIRGIYPNAFFSLNNQEIKVLEATFEENNNTTPSIITIIDKNNLAIGCANGIIYLKQIKPSGKNIMNIKDFLNGVNKEKLKNEKVN